MADGTLKVGTITTSSGSGTITLGQSGETISIPSGVSQSGLGITEADMWRLTADVTADTSPISSNWERVDESSFGKIGTGMSVSSGYWTFPSTGLYLVLGISQITAVSDSLNFKIMVTTNNSTYDEYAYVNTQISSGTIRCNNSTSAFVNVTDTSNVKVAFYITGNDGSSTLHGNSDKSETVVNFIRLGDSV